MIDNGNDNGDDDTDTTMATTFFDKKTRLQLAQVCTYICDCLLWGRHFHIPHLSNRKATSVCLWKEHVSFQHPILFVSKKEEDWRRSLGDDLDSFRSARNDVNIERRIKKEKKFGMLGICGKK